jgi:hypothetical protein
MTYWNCGTALVQGPQKEQGSGIIYGGARACCSQIGSALVDKRAVEETEKSPIAEQDLSRTEKAFLACLSWIDRSAVLIDLPLCVVADTLTLPCTISYTLRCQVLKREADRQATVSYGPAESVKER